MSVDIPAIQQLQVLENKRKVRKTKEKRLEQRARHLLGNLTSIEVAGQIIGSIEENDRVTPVDSINVDFAKKLSRRLRLDPLLWLLEKGIFSTTLAKNLEQVAAILRAQSPGSTCRGGLNVVVESDDEAQEANEVVELDDDAQDEADEAVESDSVFLIQGTHSWRGDKCFMFKQILFSQCFSYQELWFTI